MRTSAVAGTFNVIHEGHMALLRRAFQLGDRVLIGITSDEMAAQGREEYVPLALRLPALEMAVSGLG